MKSTALISVALVAALSLTACSGSEESESTPDASSAADKAKASPTAEPGIISPELPAVPAFDVEPNGVIADVKVDSCDTAKGPVAAAGTAVNSGKFARDIVVVVNWSVASTSDVVARAVATMENVEPGDTAEWTAETDLASDESVSCVTTALAGQLS